MGIIGHMVIQKKEYIGVITLAILSFGCNITKNYSDSQVIGNGNSYSEIRDLSEFTEIEINIEYDKIIVNSSSEKSLKIVGDENIVPLIKTKIINGILKISADSSFHTKAESKIIINVESLTSFTFDGVSKCIIKNLDEQHFICSFNGVGSCELTGNLDYFELSMNGVGSVDAQGLIAEKVVVSLNGVGSAVVYTTRSLNASVSGIGELIYYGDPKELILNDAGIGGISKGD